jgi:hypothetical protein
VLDTLRNSTAAAARNGGSPAPALAPAPASAPALAPAPAPEALAAPGGHPVTGQVGSGSDS